MRSFGKNFIGIIKEFICFVSLRGLLDMANLLFFSQIMLFHIHLVIFVLSDGITVQ